MGESFHRKPVEVLVTARRCTPPDRQAPLDGAVAPAHRSFAISLSALLMKMPRPEGAEAPN
jgi:hypothetical protein